MNRTAAADILAVDVFVVASETGREIDAKLVAERLSAAAAGDLGIYKKVCAGNCNPKTVLKLAIAKI